MKIALLSTAASAAASLSALVFGSPIAMAAPNTDPVGPDTSVYNGGPRAGEPKPNWMRHYTSYAAYNGIVSGGHLGKVDSTTGLPNENFFTPTLYTDGADARQQLALPGWNTVEGYIPIPPGKAMPPGLRGQSATDLPPGQQEKGYQATGQPADPHYGEPGGGIEYSKPSAVKQTGNGTWIWQNAGRGFKWVPVEPSPAVCTTDCPPY